MIKIKLQKALQFPSGSVNLEVDMQLEQGKIYAVYGSSGAGKTTLLKLIAGIMKADDGSIEVDGVNWYSEGKQLPASARKPGFVFHDFALFPNMTVLENLLFASPEKQRATDLLKILQLNHFRDKKPAQLSAGQQQRVAIARSIMNRPPLLLLDEAFSSLDSTLKKIAADLVSQYVKEEKTTAIMVTHDVPLIISMSQYAFELQEGKLANQGAPSKLFYTQAFQGLVIEIKDGLAWVQQGSEVIKIKADQLWEKGNLVSLRLY